jgi:hypothetical protein
MTSRPASDLGFAVLCVAAWYLMWVALGMGLYMLGALL